MIAAKFAEFGSARVQADMSENHGREFSRGFVSHLAEAVAVIAESQSEQTIYRLPKFDEPIGELVVALEEFEIMTSRPLPSKVALGSIGFYDHGRRRQYMVYLADLWELDSPDPRRFLGRLGREVQRARGVLDEKGQVIGISGGHAWSVEFLAKWSEVQFIDPESVMEILSRAARTHFERDRPAEGQEEDPGYRARRQRRELQEWIHDARQRLRSDGDLASLLGDLQSRRAENGTDEEQGPISEALDFLTRQNHSGRMKYQMPLAELVWANAGILANSARTIFGDRLSHPKFKIGLSAARAILILRELTRTPGRWEEFWNRITGEHGAASQPDS
jgi:hypothetical protein